MAEVKMGDKYNFLEVEKKWAKAYADFYDYRAVDFDKTREIIHRSFGNRWTSWGCLLTGLGR